MKVVDLYLESVLLPQLERKGFSQTQLGLVSFDIKQRLIKILNVWSNKEERSAYVEMSREESINYEPKKVALGIKMLVNFTIRNSIIEELHADTPYINELDICPDKKITDGEMKSITKAAIKYFSDNWKGITSCNSLKYDFKNTHPITYKCFSELSKITSGSKTYTPVSDKLSFVIENKYDFSAKSFKRENSVCLSGFAPTLDEKLSSAISHVRKEKGVFFIPNFKMLTRNVEKLYDIFELLLSSGVPVVTLNYYLSNGNVCKREKFLPIAHSFSDVDHQMKDLKGLSKKHKSAIKKG